MMTSVAQICGHFGCSDKATIVQGKKKDVPEEGGGFSGRDISFLFLEPPLSTGRHGYRNY